MVEAARAIAARQSARFVLVVPNEELAGVARTFLSDGPPKIDLQVGGLKEALLSATVALSKSGTITMECAFFGVPAVVIYKTDWGTYLLGRWMVNVKYLSMPNLLADEAVYPELIQGRAVAGDVAAAVLELLGAPERRDQVRAKLGRIMRSLGGPGAARRAAAAIVKLMGLDPVEGDIFDRMNRMDRMEKSFGKIGDSPKGDGSWNQ
jgi:lipid-A-disaccharide synthase